MAAATLATLEARLARIEVVLQRIPQVMDPPPDDFPRWSGWGGWRPTPIPWPNPGDPVPIDISRLSKAQLEVSLQSIKAQRIRLEAMEAMITNQMKRAK